MPSRPGEFHPEPLTDTRNVSGQHELEIDALSSASGHPTCYRYQSDDHEGSQSAHYVATVLLRDAHIHIRALGHPPFWRNT
jgi:hypothetical protein